MLSLPGVSEVNILVFCICRLTASLVARRIIISGSTSFPSASTSAKSDGHHLHPFCDCRENQVVAQIRQNLAFLQKKTSVILLCLFGIVRSCLENLVQYFLAECQFHLFEIFLLKLISSPLETHPQSRCNRPCRCRCGRVRRRCPCTHNAHHRHGVGEVDVIDPMGKAFLLFVGLAYLPAAQTSTRPVFVISVYSPLHCARLCLSPSAGPYNLGTRPSRACTASHSCACGRLSCMQGWSGSFLQSITRQNTHTVYESWYRRGAQLAFTERQLKLFEKKPVHHVLHGTHFCQTMLLSQYLFFNNRQGQFSVWKQCLSTSRFSSTSSNWQLRPHKHFFSSLAQQKCTLCHISLSTTMKTMSAPLPFLSSLPSHVARFHLKPFHFICSFLIQVWASPFAPLLGPQIGASIVFTHKYAWQSFL